MHIKILAYTHKTFLRLSLNVLFFCLVLILQPITNKWLILKFYNILFKKYCKIKYIFVENIINYNNSAVILNAASEFYT